MTAFSAATLPLADWRAWLTRALEIALVLVLAWQGARLAWLLLPSRPGIPAETAPGAAPATAGFPAGFDPFHPGREAAAATRGDAYTLLAVRHGPRAGAILAGADGVQRAWLVGDTVAPGVRLLAVGDGDATLQVGGRRHTIALPEADRDPAHPPDDRAAAAGAPATAAPADAPSGLRIDVDHPSLALAGLRRGDVIVAVDGQPPAHDLLASLPARLARGERIAVTVRRAGRNLSLHLEPPSP